MPESNLKIGATFDKSQIDEGFDASGQAAQNWTAKLNILFDSAAGTSKRAFKSISDDAKSMAASVTTEQGRIAEATRAVAIANNDVRQSMVLLKAGTVDEKSAMDLLAASQQQAALAAHELKAALDAVAGPSHKAVTDVQATSAAIRSLEGNPGIRALENFLAKTLGLGPAMSAIFPLIGAYAFGKILFDIGEKAYETEQKAAHAGKAFEEAYDEAHDKAQVVNDDLQLTNDKLQDQIDKLSGHPNNGLTTALDEARKMADKLLESLQSDRKALDALLKEHEVGAVGSMFSGVASTGKQASELLADQAELTEAVRKAKDQYEEDVKGASDPKAIVEAGNRRNEAVRVAFQAQIDTYATESKRLHAEQVVGDSQREADIAAGGTGRGGIDNSAKIADIEGRGKQIRDALAKEQKEELTPVLQTRLGQLKQDKQDKPKKDTQAEDDYKAQEAALNQMKIDGPMSAKEIFDFWEVQKTAFERGSQQYNAIVAKQAEIAVQSANKIHEEIKRLREREKVDAAQGAAAFEKGNTGLGKWVKETSDDLAQAGPRWDGYWREIARGKEVIAGIDEQMREGRLSMLLATGALTPLAFAQQSAGLHAEMHAAKVAALREELERLEKTAKRDPQSGNATDPKQAQGIASAKNQLTQELGKGQVQGAKDNSAVSAAVAAPYLKAFATIESSWMGAQRQMLAGHKGFAASMQQVWAGIAMSGIENIEKIAVKMIANEFRMLAAHAAANAMKTSSDIASTAISSEVHHKGLMKEVFGDAKAAAAAAYKATAGIPVIGPALAPIAAGASFAGVMSLAAFEQGTMHVPRAGIAMLHPGEAVLGSPGAQVMRDVLAGGGSGGRGDVHLNMGGNNFTAADGNFRGQFDAHQNHVRAQVKRWIRDGEL